MNIRRSPLRTASLWSFASRNPIILDAAKEEEMMEEQEEVVVKAVVVPAAPSPAEVHSELQKLRAEFSAKKEACDSPSIAQAKLFLSSPALWKTLSSTPADSPQHAASDPLLRNWNSPAARRSLFSRSDSASAA